MPDASHIPSHDRIIETETIVPHFWDVARERPTMVRALKVAIVVGSLLMVINQAELLLNGGVPPLWKVILTYCVPYCVSTYSAASFKIALAKDALVAARTN